MADYYASGMAAKRAGAAPDPLFGWLPRRVKAPQVEKALEGDVNPFTKAPHSSSYKKILEARKKLPVYAQMAEFFTMVSDPQHCLLRGEVRVCSSPGSPVRTGR